MGSTDSIYCRKQQIRIITVFRKEKVRRFQINKIKSEKKAKCTVTVKTATGQ